MKLRNFFDISDLTKEELLFILNLESDKKSLTNMNLGTIYENTQQEQDYLLLLLYQY